jgi:hypothetical protein
VVDVGYSTFISYVRCGGELYLSEIWHRTNPAKGSTQHDGKTRLDGNHQNSTSQAWLTCRHMDAHVFRSKFDVRFTSVVFAHGPGQNDVVCTGHGQR